MTTSQKLELEKMAEDHVGRDYHEPRYGTCGMASGRGHWMLDRASEERLIYDLLTKAFEMGVSCAGARK